MSLFSSCIYIGVIEVRDLDEEMAGFLPLSFADPHPLVLLPFSLFYVSLVYTHTISPLLCRALGPHLQRVSKETGLPQQCSLGVESCCQMLFTQCLA